MEVDFDDDNLQRLEVEPGAGGGMDQAVVRGFRKVMQAIRAAADERDLYAVKSLRFEKLKGTRSRQRSLRINKQWRLIVELDGEGVSKRLKVIEIVDYH